MRALVCCCLLALGCSSPAALETDPVPDPPDQALPPDLGTRRDGSDWPGFLGPNGDSTSPEKGLLVPWPEQGPRLVWQVGLGTGYGMPSISRGRLFLFDRVRDRARLR